MVADGGEDQDWRRTSPHNAMFTGLGAAFVILAIGFVAAWVVSDSGPGASTGGGGHDEMVFGEPGDPATADRVINMEMLDSLAFDPATVEVGAGETVTFRVTNVGSLMHDFTLGDEATQEAHAAEMADMGPMGGMDGVGDPNAMTVEPGETKDLTWTFAEPSGDLLIGCHIPGHFEAGMVAQVTVT